MNKFLTTAIYFAFSLIAINGANAQSTSLIEFDSVVIHKTAGPCKNNDSSFCYRINIIYPRAVSADINSQNIINQFITKKIISNLINDYDTIHNDMSVNTIDDAIQFLINTTLKDTIEDYKDPFRMPWQNDLNVTLRFQNKNYITLIYDLYEDEGGAHGLEQLYFYTFDKVKFRQLTISDIVTDTNKLNTIGEKLFREQWHIAPNVSLNDGQYTALYNFSPSFYLSRNFCIINDTLISHYNNYEISGYNGIGWELSVPLSSISDILKEPFKHEVQEEK